MNRVSSLLSNFTMSGSAYPQCHIGLLASLTPSVAAAPSKSCRCISSSCTRVTAVMECTPGQDTDAALSFPSTGDSILGTTHVDGCVHALGYCMAALCVSLLHLYICFYCSCWRLSVQQQIEYPMLQFSGRSYDPSASWRPDVTSAACWWYRSIAHWYLDWSRPKTQATVASMRPQPAGSMMNC